MTNDERMQTCNREISEVLKKYDCMLVYEQMTRNGIPIDGRFRCIPNQVIQGATEMPVNGSLPGLVKPII